MNNKQIEDDWENRHQTEQMKAVMGKEMGMDEFWQSGEVRYLKTIQPLFSIYRNDIENMVVLEIGCGPGRILRPFAKRAKRAIGVDVSRTAIDTIRENLSEFNNAEFIKNNGDKLDLIGDNLIDVVVSFDVFQHMPTFDVQMSYLKEVSRVLKNEGVFVIQVKSNSGWLAIMGVPVFPRRFRLTIPRFAFDAYLKLSGKRSQRMKDTWRGNLLSHKKINQVFQCCGLRVDKIIPDGHGTRWIVVGQPDKLKSHNDQY